MRRLCNVKHWLSYWWMNGIDGCMGYTWKGIWWWWQILNDEIAKLKEAIKDSAKGGTRKDGRFIVRLVAWTTQMCTNGEMVTDQVKVKIWKDQVKFQIYGSKDLTEMKFENKHKVENRRKRMVRLKWMLQSKY